MLNTLKGQSLRKKNNKKKNHYLMTQPHWTPPQVLQAEHFHQQQYPHLELQEGPENISIFNCTQFNDHITVNIYDQDSNSPF